MSPRRRSRAARRPGHRRARGRLALTPVAAASFVAAVGGFALLDAGPAGADATAANDLGGFQVTASASGIRTTYEQPNVPVPATPSLEANIGYATTSYNYGPSGTSTASTLWPGQVVAGFGENLPTLLQPYLGANTPNLNAGPWPVQATTSYPAAPGGATTASQDATGVTMEASSTQDSGTATADFGTGTGQDATAALPSGVVTVQSIGSTVLGEVRGTNAGARAVSQATAALHGVSVAGGLITAGAITTTATSTSDGTDPAQVTGSSAVSQLSIAGQPVTIDQNGLHVAGNSEALLGSLLPSVNQVLATAGITIALEQPTDTVGGESAQRVLPGLQVTIDLTQFDSKFNALLAMLPAQVQSGIDQIPIPLPAEQIMVINLGWVDVAASASPALPSSDGSGPATTGSTDNFSSPGPGSGSLGTLGTSGTSATPGFTSPAGGSSPLVPASTPTQAVDSAPVALFKGLGAGLIALGLLLAAALAFLLLRADAAVGALAAAPECAGEEHPGP